ncbi:FAD-dependent oxidoreductase [Paenibacillus cymbidii]|uniref:FAD-dependent oxidoreductase n=1 Tax=Paenibacillus cymbidii TaxID=1639034 RepID=UPI0010806FFD|nr:FAD-dependent oxidoreductase [Paenibacillus cymbidii]
METYTETKTIPAIDAADVIVVGGGSAGIMAAIAAARLGSKVLLIDPSSAPGGTSIIGLPLAGFHDGVRSVVGGIPDEFMNRLEARGGLWGPRNAAFIPSDPEIIKMIAIEMLEEADVEMLLHTMVVDAVVREGRIDGVIVEGKGGRRLLRAPLFVDASGDGDVCHYAGVPMMKEEGELQPPTLMFVVGNIDMDRFEEAGGYSVLMRTYQEISAREQFRNPRRNELSGGWRLGSRKNELAFNVTRILNIDATDPRDLTRAEVEGRHQAWEFLDRFLKPHIAGFEQAFITNTFHRVGVRETRRIVGEYVIREEDLWQFRKFDDAVCCGCYPIDVHHASSESTHYPKEHFYNGQYYSIPYRALVPLRVDNVLAAGRCLSSDHVAFGGLRVIGNTMGTGQAAGTAAALCLQHDVIPRELDVDLLRDTLRQHGAFLGVPT